MEGEQGLVVVISANSQKLIMFHKIVKAKKKVHVFASSLIFEQTSRLKQKQKKKKKVFGCRNYSYILVPKVVSNWMIAHVIEWAKAQRDVIEEDWKKLQENCVDGSALLLLTKEELRSIGIPLGPAANLAAAIEKLRAPTGTP